MAVPEGYEKLAVLGISYKGNYDETLTYNYLNAVYYEGSTYIAIKDNVTTIPGNDGVNWKYLARGFITHLLSELTAIDNQGLLDVAGSTVDAQDLIDKIADELVNGDTANNTVTFENSDASTADAWTDVAVLATGEKHSSLFAKISTMFKNIRYIYTHFIKSENILETLEEIVANTQSGKVAGALAVKELNSNLSDIGKTCCFRQSNESNVYNGYCAVNIQEYNDDTSLFHADGSGVLITRPGTYIVQAHFHLFWAQNDEIDLSISNSIQELLHSSYKDINYDNSKQLQITLTKVVKITSGEDRVLIRIESKNNTSYIFDWTLTNINRIAITKIA